MKFLATFLVFCGVVSIPIQYHIAFYGLTGLYGPPDGRFFNITRFLLRPVHFAVVWSPLRPETEDRITGLLCVGHLLPRRTKRLLEKAGPELLAHTVRYWPGLHVSDEMAEHVYHVLRDSLADWPTIEHFISDMVSSSALLTKVALTELESPAPSADPVGHADAVAYGLSQAKALDISVLNALSAGFGILVASFTSSNQERPDPVRALWPEEDRSELGHILYFMRQLSLEHASFQDIITDLKRCLPTHQPGWAYVGLPYLREVSLLQRSRFPKDGIEQIHKSTELLRLRADCITKAAALRRSGAPGDFPQLIELIDAL